MIYDKKLIIPGLVIFVWLMTIPFWYNSGKASAPPEVKIDTPAIQELAEKKCIQEKGYMRETHMQILDEWRDEVVRERKRVEVTIGGKTYEMSLQNECMKCHSNKAEFCDKCHDYVAVDPYCWDCHIEPKETK